jgi:crotonobetainyl-CoA:carnitine CoA-transferase CaiB-like acyl-CoA transferase
MTDRALGGILVLDLGQIYLGPYCTLLLSRLGAEVIKIEPLEGEPYRRLGEGGLPLPQFSLVNSGKRGIRLDLKSEEGKDILLRLARKADVLVENFAPGAMNRLGLGFDTLSAVNPRLVMASGTGYGSTGPHKDHRALDITVQARTAFMTTTGFPDHPPVRTGPSVIDFLTGAHLTAAILAALVQREHSGLGQHVEVAMQDAALPSLTSNISGYIAHDGQIPERTGNHHGALAVCPYNSYPTLQGWVAILCSGDRQWQDLCQAAGLGSLALEADYQTNAARVRHMDEIDIEISKWTSELTTDAVVIALETVGVPCAPVLGIPEVLNDENVRARGVIRQMTDPDGGTWWTIGNPLTLPGSADVPITRAPDLGQHSAEVLREHLGITAAEFDSLSSQGVV